MQVAGKVRSGCPIVRDMANEGLADSKIDQCRNKGQSSVPKKEQAKLVGTHPAHQQKERNKQCSASHSHTQEQSRRVLEHKSLFTPQACEETRQANQLSPPEASCSAVE